MGFYIDMISVGEGDSFLLTMDDDLGNLVYVLIDGGPEKSSAILVKHLKSITTGHLDLVIATHLDSDHIGGLEEIVKNFSIGKFIINVPGNIDKWTQARETLLACGQKVISLMEIAKSISEINSLLKRLKEKNPPVVIERALQGNGWNVGQNIKLMVLNPTKERLELAWADQLLKDSVSQLLLEKAEAPTTSPSNDSSIVLELIYKGSPYALFAADAGAAVIKEVTQGKSYPFLKIPHHGSKTGLDKELVAQLKPKSAFLPVGENRYGHPDIEVLDMLRDVGAQTYCSEKTKNCRKECKEGGYGNLCHKNDKDSRPGWSNVNSEDCKNNTKKI